jgi:hypothetical protein
MRGLFFLWRLCGVHVLETTRAWPTACHEAELRQQVPILVVSSLPTDGPPLAPSRNVGVSFLNLVASTDGPDLSWCCSTIALVGHHEWQPQPAAPSYSGASLYLKAVRSPA